MEDLSFTVPRGEVFGFLGPNGAGKTTTIRLLLDLIRPTAGRAEVLGLDVNTDSVEVRRRTGYLPGDLSLPARSTAGGYLDHLARLRGGVQAGAVAELAERLGLTLDRRISDLSKGNRQKVGLVGAFMHDPELLVLDEPTSGLDPLRQRDVLDLISERASAGRTVFLSSHALDQVEQVAHRVGVIREGSLVAVETIEALTARAPRRVEVSFDGPVPDGLREVAGVQDLEMGDGVARMVVAGAMAPLISELALHPVRILTAKPPELDDIFLSYYRGDADAG